MSEDGTQKWIGRNRPPRVQITYDLETRGAIEKKELPLVVGIIAALGGDNPNPGDVAALKLQKFVEIDRDNFDDVMRLISPSLSLSAFGAAKETYTFSSIADFAPDALVKKVPGLKDKLEDRRKLTDLLALVDGRDAVGDKLLQESKDPATRPSSVKSGTDAEVAQQKAYAEADTKKKAAYKTANEKKVADYATAKDDAAAKATADVACATAMADADLAFATAIADADTAKAGADSVTAKAKADADAAKAKKDTDAMKTKADADALKATAEATRAKDYATADAAKAKAVAGADAAKATADAKAPETPKA